MTIIPDPRQAEAEAAKARMLSTVERIKARFTPDLIKRDAMHALSERASKVADSIGDAAAKRPAVTAAATAGIAFILLHKPIRWILRSIFKEK